MPICGSMYAPASQRQGSCAATASAADIMCLLHGIACSRTSARCVSKRRQHWVFAISSCNTVTPFMRCGNNRQKLIRQFESPGTGGARVLSSSNRVMISICHFIDGRQRSSFLPRMPDQSSHPSEAPAPGVSHMLKEDSGCCAAFNLM